MRRMLLYTAAGLLPALGLLIAPGVTEAGGKAGVPKSVLTTPAATECKGDFGTSLKFLKTPSDAAREAQKEEKLVFVLHVSGLFEDPDFT